MSGEVTFSVALSELFPTLGSLDVAAFATRAASSAAGSPTSSSRRFRYTDFGVTSEYWRSPAFLISIVLSILYSFDRGKLVTVDFARCAEVRDGADAMLR